MTTQQRPPLRLREVWVSLLFALGLMLLLAVAMAAVMAMQPADEARLDWPMIATALVAALYVAASWQFVPSMLWFVIGLGVWTVGAFVLLAVLPIEWLEFLFGHPQLATEEIPTIVVPAADAPPAQ
ncbi:MAG: hypothetical protein R3F55_15295 [Alphaproteobacteria bacterium]